MDKTCGSIQTCLQDKVLLFKKKGYPVFKCQKCGFQYSPVSDIDTHLNKVYSDDYFFAGGAGYPNYLDEKEVLYNSGIKYAKIISKYTTPGKVLDVGCAAGFYLKGFAEQGWSCKGVEPNDTMASYGRKELNLDIFTGGLETFETDQKFDLINLIEVIGSFYDLHSAMLNVQNLLKQGGLVLVESWDVNSTVARFFEKSWHEYCPPSVLNWFSDKTLTELFKYYGFEIIAKGRPAKKIKGKHAIEILARNSPKFFFKNNLFNFLNRLVGKITFSYPPLDLKWYLFKKL